jgi:non-canonical (house-cleaning) NTP pyrophosphatase
MNVALGTKSEEKLAVFRKIVNDMGLDWNILPLAAVSGVSSQPLSEKETVDGAINRAMSAKNTLKDCDLGIGLEGGLNKYSDNLFSMICVCAIVDVKGEIYIGKSLPIPLPVVVSDRIDKGYEYGIEIRNYSRDSEDGMKVILGELISRTASFTDAITSCIKLILQKD